jgi:hypothetical protein
MVNVVMNSRRQTNVEGEIKAVIEEIIKIIKIIKNRIFENLLNIPQMSFDLIYLGLIRSTTM